MGQKRVITDMEVLGTGYSGRNPRRVLGILRPLTEPLGVRRLEATRHHRSIQRQCPLAVERKRVIQLEYLPRLAKIRLRIRVGSRLEGCDADLVAHDVVGMPVTTVALVVGGHDMRSERPNQLDQWRGRNGNVHEREAPLRQRRRRLAFG
jgi:hypothetical protein